LGLSADSFRFLDSLAKGFHLIDDGVNFSFERGGVHCAGGLEFDGASNEFVESFLQGSELITRLGGGFGEPLDRGVLRFEGLRDSGPVVSLRAPLRGQKLLVHLLWVELSKCGVDLVATLADAPAFFHAVVDARHDVV
jgi:hypothetical protein